VPIEADLTASTVTLALAASVEADLTVSTVPLALAVSGEAELTVSTGSFPGQGVVNTVSRRTIFGAVETLYCPWRLRTTSNSSEYLESIDDK
jgi:hypothetical protein